jgi:hypothetical protein
MRADGIALLLESARQKDIGDRDKTSPAPRRPTSRPARELFIVSRTDGDPRVSGLGPAGIALVIGLILLVAYGIYAG